MTATMMTMIWMNDGYDGWGSGAMTRWDGWAGRWAMGDG